MDETVLRTPKCPKCTMTFRIEQQNQKKHGLICPDCGLVFKERNTGAGGNAILSVGSLEDAERAWG